MTTINKIKNAKITSVAIASILLITCLSLTSTAYAKAPTPIISFDIQPNPVLAGNQVVMSGNLELDDGTPVTGGNLTIEQGYLADGLTVAHTCNEATNWDDKSGHLGHGDGSFSWNGFDTSSYGGQTIVFRVHNSADGNVSGNAFSDCTPLDINVEAPCEGDLQIAATNTVADPDNGMFDYTITVTACTDVENLKIQGGSNGWSTIDSVTPSQGGIDQKILKKNTVYIWTIPELGSDDNPATLTVMMSTDKEISCGEKLQINGGWSASYNLKDENTKLKTGYTDPITWMNDCS